jgi:hypothetical protein
MHTTEANHNNNLKTIYNHPKEERRSLHFLLAVNWKQDHFRGPSGDQSEYKKKEVVELKR